MQQPELPGKKYKIINTQKPCFFPETFYAPPGMVLRALWRSTQCSVLNLVVFYHMVVM